MLLIFSFAADCSNPHCFHHTSRTGITGFIFIFSEMEVIHDEIKTLGMELVQVLHGQGTENGVEAVFIPSFPSSYDLFSEVYNLHADLIAVE